MRKVTQTASHWGACDVETVDGAIHATVLFTKDVQPARHVGSLPDRPHVRESYLRHREKAPRNRGGRAFVPVSWQTARSRNVPSPCGHSVCTA
jgi:hypothetical protein